MQQRLRPVEPDAYFAILGVAKGKVKADLYLRGATVINVYTGELQEVNVAVKGKHIAYVGMSDAMVGPETKTVDLEGRFLCPGYIEPHCHPFNTYNPTTLARFVLPRGTTAMVNDNMGLYLRVELDRFLELIEQMGTWPIKMLWSARVDPQTEAEDLRPFFAPERMKRLLAHPLVVQAGELTAWPQLLNGDTQIAENLLQTMQMGKRIEGHLPGASLETLSMLAAGGLTAEHEAMTAEEVIRRLRIGYWTTLRYSSLRPDLPEIVQGLAGYHGDTKRIMMTTDGSTPAFLAEGFTDELLRVAMNNGMDPIVAYQTVTINPATYYGLDGEIGGIAPGRLADILVLEDLREPTPIAVMAEGRWVARSGNLLESWPGVDWQTNGMGKLQVNWRVAESDFTREENLPIIHLENPAITRLLEDAGDRTVLHAALVNEHSIVEANLTGMADRMDGFACSNTASIGIFTFGRDRASMAQAVNRVLEIGGGVVIVENGQILFEMELPLAGAMAEQELEPLILQVQTLIRLLKERGHTHYDPIFTMLFISATHLPEVRLTTDGVLHVKSGHVIRPPRTRN
ncbi:adenine deaminase C-terminal domain-containing protein [Effusibacillus dendaii]|uniref:adenine deaminase n=1 Tax=Effusibacillus dendaii TaxID=2743772 RepID=A0A7I8D999_9BACL|nr:adenine deaminase C-terminal domain-containing protein [Effusibacillus dendaii]BCJ86694.1 putative adenine deaminase [Effusibacillus dendaii]